ncbi:hypothetical protein Btru_019888 [Bulinus truncatus]|nr:hypothetical protein Btru_019888 [Bulinus truncatus]
MLLFSCLFLFFFVVLKKRTGAEKSFSQISKNVFCDKIDSSLNSSLCSEMKFYQIIAIMAINPQYFYSISRDIDVCHKTGILRFTSKLEYFLPVGQFISDSPLSAKCSKFSFEILNCGKGCNIAIGVCPSNYLPRRMPGWNFGSFAYHADDGGIYTGMGWPQECTVTCTIGDVMKCEVDFENKWILFYKNNNLISTVKNISDFGNFHAVVGFHSPGSAVRLLEKEPWQTKETVPPSVLEARRFVSSQNFWANFCSWLVIGFLIALFTIKEFFTNVVLDKKCIVIPTNKMTAQAPTKSTATNTIPAQPPTECMELVHASSIQKTSAMNILLIPFSEFLKSIFSNKDKTIISKTSPNTVINIIKEMIVEINTEYKRTARTNPQKKMLSPSAPQRETLDFVKYAADCDDVCPSYWSGGCDGLVDVYKRTRDCIERLIKSTSFQSVIGQGNNAGDLVFNEIDIVDIKRVQNMKLFGKYQTARRELLRKTAESNKLCQDIDTITNSTGGVLTTKHLCDFMKQELITEINEHYLFHGTREDLVETLTNRGLDYRVSSPKCRFGKGIYMAESFSKADSYTEDARSALKGTELYMLLVRSLLGNVCRLADDNYDLCRAPCKLCRSDRCICQKQDLYDSVMGDKKRKFRQFVVYSNNQCYHEYLITYKRM